MDYAKLHKDTITKLQEMVNSGKITVEVARETCADFVPESEDERIRKAISQCVEDMRGQFEKLYGVHHKDAIAWLEKQYKKDEEIILLKDKIESLESARIAMQECHRLELEKLEKQGEQKPAWSEEDKRMFESVLWHLRNSVNNGDTEHSACQLEIWFKSLKDRVQPQPKQEWSEDVESAISLLKSMAEEQERDYCPHNANHLRKAAQYLETFRPQNTWKPSDEQMQVLVWCKHLFAEPKLKGILESLINNLKKLREE